MKFAPDAAMLSMRGVVMAESGLFDWTSPQPKSSARTSTTLGREGSVSVLVGSRATATSSSTDQFRPDAFHA